MGLMEGCLYTVSRVNGPKMKKRCKTSTTGNKEDIMTLSPDIRKKNT